MISAINNYGSEDAAQLRFYRSRQNGTALESKSRIFLLQEKMEQPKKLRRRQLKQRPAESARLVQPISELSTFCSSVEFSLLWLQSGWRF
jgi:hypothetical protein